MYKIISQSPGRGNPAPTLTHVINNLVQHSRHTIRLKRHDYTKPCTYFITVGSYKHGLIFGEIKNNDFIPNTVGQIILKKLEETKKHFKNIKISSQQLMPNHLHFILEIIGAITIVGAGFPRPLAIGHIIAFLKYTSTKEINQHKLLAHFQAFQRNYHEHIIRTPVELIEIKNYIKQNPTTWQQDRNHPKNIKP